MDADMRRWGQGDEPWNTRNTRKRERDEGGIYDLGFTIYEAGGMDQPRNTRKTRKEDMGYESRE